METGPSSFFVCFPATYMYPRVPITPATVAIAYRDEIFLVSTSFP